MPYETEYQVRQTDFTPANGGVSYLGTLRQQADQAEQDALLAQQQADEFARQQQAETEAYKAQLDALLAQQPAMYDQALLQQREQAIQQQQAKINQLERELQSMQAQNTAVYSKNRSQQQHAYQAQPAQTSNASVSAGVAVCMIMLAFISAIFWFSFLKKK